VNSNNVEADFQRAVSAQVRLAKESEDRFRVLTPFVLEDGDHLAIILKREDGRWILSDEGHTYMQLTYDLSASDLLGEGRGDKIREALSFFSLADRRGELIREIRNDDFGEALYAFVQGLIRIAEVGLLTRPHEELASVGSPEYDISSKQHRELSVPQFREAFRDLIRKSVDGVYSFDWHDQAHDRSAKYTVDCRLEAITSPLFIYLLTGNEKVRDATIALHQFQEWRLEFRPVGIFRNAARIKEGVKERFKDVCSTMFSRFDEKPEEIADYLESAVQE
jgi:Domain of unknown function DUF1828